MEKSIVINAPYSLSGAKMSTTVKLTVERGKINISGVGAGNIKMNLSLGDIFPDLYDFNKFCRLDDNNIAFDAKIRAYDSHGHARFVLSSMELKRVCTYDMESNFRM